MSLTSFLNDQFNSIRRMLLDIIQRIPSRAGNRDKRQNIGFLQAARMRLHWKRYSVGLLTRAWLQHAGIMPWRGVMWLTALEVYKCSYTQYQGISSRQDTLLYINATSNNGDSVIVAKIVARHPVIILALICVELHLSVICCFEI